MYPTISPPGIGMLSSSKSHRSAMRLGGSTCSYTPSMRVPHSIVALNRPLRICTGTPIHRE
jgi:hypothetical protein